MKKLLIALLLIPSLVFGQATGLPISDKPSGGAIGTAGSTVDVATKFSINQTTASQTLTVPNLTTSTAGKQIYLRNVGSVSFTLSPGGLLIPGTGALLDWTGAAWNVIAVGYIPSSISGLTIEYVPIATSSGTIGNSSMYTSFGVFNIDYNDIYLNGGGYDASTFLWLDNSKRLSSSQTVLQTATRLELLPPDGSGGIRIDDGDITYFRSATLKIPGGLANKLLFLNGANSVKPIYLGSGLTLTDSTLSSTAAADTTSLSNRINLKANIASPTFTGTVTIPTPFTLGATSVTSTGTQLNYLNAATGTTGTTSTNIVFSASPALTGNPTAPTQTASDSSTKIATTAYVDAAVDVTYTDNVFTWPCFAGVLSPADNDSYYSGAGQLIPSTSITTVDFNIGYKCTVIGAVISVSANTTAGTSENITFQIRNATQATSSSVGVFQSNLGSATVSPTFTFTGLSIAVAATDFIACQFDTPAWVTNPVGTRWNVVLILARAL